MTTNDVSVTGTCSSDSPPVCGKQSTNLLYCLHYAAATADTLHKITSVVQAAVKLLVALSRVTEASSTNDKLYSTGCLFVLHTCSQPVHNGHLYRKGLMPHCRHL